MTGFENLADELSTEDRRRLLPRFAHLLTRQSKALGKELPPSVEHFLSTSVLIDEQAPGPSTQRRERDAGAVAAPRSDFDPSNEGGRAATDRPPPRRPKHELRQGVMLRREMERVLRGELAVLRGEVAGLRNDLGEKVNSELRLERIETSRASSADIEELQHEVRRLAGGRRTPAVPEPTVVSFDVSPDAAETVHDLEDWLERNASASPTPATSRTSRVAAVRHWAQLHGYKAHAEKVSAALQASVQKLDQAIELRSGSPVPNVVGDQATALAALVESIADTQQAVVRVGSLLIVKLDTTVVVRTLSALELRVLESNPEFLQQPSAVMKLIQQDLSPGTP
jgi:hypothetical protein